MPLIKWTPFLEPLEEMDKWFEDWSTHWPTKITGFVPAVDVWETKNEVVVETSLAGVEPEKVDISVKDDILTIKGKSERRTEVDEKDYYRKEVKYGSFYRTVSLPTQVVGEKAKAFAENGMLKVTIPKAPEAKAKEVKVQVAKATKKTKKK